MFSEMINHQTNGKTLLTVNSIDIGLKIKTIYCRLKALNLNNMTAFFTLLIPLFVYSDIDDDWGVVEDNGSY